MYNNIDVMFQQSSELIEMIKKKKFHSKNYNVRDIVQIKLGSAQYYIHLNLYFYTL